MMPYLQVLGVRNIKRKLRLDEDTIMGGILICAIVLSIVIFFYIVFRDPCNSSRIQQQICEQYEDGIAVGNLCYNMCHQGTSFRLGYCVAQNVNGWNEFVSGKHVFYVPSDISHNLVNSSYPPEGTTLGTFTSSIHHYIQSQLGSSDQSFLVQKLITYADSNTNGQLSLSEARNLWTLLHSHNFILYFLFHKHFHFPNLNGTCGSLIALTNVFTNQLYTQSSYLISPLFRDSHLWGVPKWRDRVKITVGLLESIFTLYETYGVEFEFCDINERSLTYDYKNTEGTISDMTPVISRHLLEQKLENISCSSHSDCVYTTQCTTICDMETRHCTGVPVVPMLAQLCTVLKSYLLPDAPRHVVVELNIYLRDCSALRNTNVDYEFDNNVVLNDLSSYLWDMIKYELTIST